MIKLNAKALENILFYIRWKLFLELENTLKGDLLLA